MYDQWKAAMLFLIVSATLNAQTDIPFPDELNQYDSSGYRHGYWIQFLNKKLKETKSEKEAAFKIYNRYYHGQKYPNGIFNYPWPAKFSIYIDENRIDTILKSRIDKEIPFLNGAIFAMNNYGDTLYTQSYTAGFPVGRFVWRDYPTAVPFIVYDFGEIGSGSVELWERSALQESEGPFEDHGVIGLSNDTVFYTPVIDELSDDMVNVQVFIYCNEKPGSINDALFTLNDYYVLALSGSKGYLNFNMNCSDFPACESIKISRASLMNPMIERVVLNEGFPNGSIVLKFNFQDGKFVSVDLIDVTEGMNDLCIPVSKTTKWKRTPAEKFEWFREKPNRREYRKWQKDHFTQL